MPSTSYIIAVLAIVFVITFALRSVPFTILKPLRDSRFIGVMAMWMPAGILVVLAGSTFLASSGEQMEFLPHAAVACVVTAVVHLAAERRTLLSVGIGTVVFIVLRSML